MRYSYTKTHESRVIQELVKNSRRSDRDIASLLDIHQSTVCRIRKNLQDKGIIIGYTTCRDYLKAEYNMVMIGFKCKKIDKRYYQTLYEFLDITPYLTEKSPLPIKYEQDIILVDIYECIGDQDFLFTIASKDDFCLKRYINMMEELFSEYIDGDITIVQLANIIVKNELINNENLVISKHKTVYD